jgi:hypothetical protein
MAIADEVLKQVISLKLDLAAHVAVLQNSKVWDQDGHLIDWKKMVERMRADLDSSQAESLYSEISKRFLSSKPESDARLQALLDLLNHRGPLESK